MPSITTPLQKRQSSISLGRGPKELKRDGVIIYGINGKPISARNANQQLMVDSFAKNDLTFALGPAGTGKTYIAIALAVRALKNREVRKIILSRPAVEAGEKLGFLPGDMKDKIDPYLQPLYDAPRGYDTLAQAQGVYGEQRDTDRAACIYAWPYAQRCRDSARRGAEHHRAPDQNVPHPPGHERQDDNHRRRDPDRPARSVQSGLVHAPSGCSTAYPALDAWSMQRKTSCATRWCSA